MRRRTGLLVTTLFVLATAFAGGCADPNGPPVARASSAAAAFPVTVGQLTLPARPERIIALSPSATEMLFAIGAGAQVTAVDNLSNHPPGVPKSDLSGFEPNAEAIAARNPDLVVLSNDMNKIVDQLAQLKIPVFMTPSATTLDDTYRQIGDLGALTGHPAEAAALVRSMTEEIAALVKQVPPRPTKLRYYYELDPTYYSATSRTFIGSLFALVGLQSVADAADPDGKKGGFPQLSQEALLAADPDMIFLADTKCCRQSAESVAARPGWSGITAVKTGQIVGLDDDIASRWGPRVVELVRAIVGAVSRVPQ